MIGDSFSFSDPFSDTNYQMKLNIQCVNLSSSSSRGHRIASICWFSGRVPQSRKRPVLAICYENGRVQIMRNENDDGKELGHQE